MYIFIYVTYMHICLFLPHTWMHIYVDFLVFSTKKNQPNPVAVSTNCAPNIDL